MDVKELLAGCLAVLLTRIYQGLTVPKAGRVAFYRRVPNSWAQLPRALFPPWQVPGVCQACCLPPPRTPDLMAVPNRGKVRAELSQEENSKNHLPSFLIPFPYNGRGLPKKHPYAIPDIKKDFYMRQGWCLWYLRPAILGTRDLHASFLKFSYICNKRHTQCVRHISFFCV